MRTIEVQLNYNNRTTGDISLNDEEQRILIIAQKYPSAIISNYTLLNPAGYTETHPINDYVTRISRLHYDIIKVDIDCKPSEGLNGEIHIGSWPEIVMVDLEINLNMYFQKPIEGTTGFRIGLAQMANLYVEIDKAGNFMIRRTLVMSPTSVATHDDFVLKGTDTAERIERIYNRIVENVANQSFANRQVSQVEILSERLFNFLREY